MQCSVVGGGALVGVRPCRGVAWCGGARSGWAGLARAFPLHGASESRALSLGVCIGPLLARRPALYLLGEWRWSRERLLHGGSGVWHGALLGEGGRGSGDRLSLSPPAAPAIS